MNRQLFNKAIDASVNILYRKCLKPKNIMMSIGGLFITVGLGYYVPSIYDIILKVFIKLISNYLNENIDISDITNNLTFAISTIFILLGICMMTMGYINKVPFRKRICIFKHSSLFSPTYPSKKSLESKFNIVGEQVINLEEKLSGQVLNNSVISEAIAIQDSIVRSYNKLENFNAIAYMGIASIPFVMRLGYSLGDEKEYILFENYKTKNVGFKELCKYKFSALMDYPALELIEESLNSGSDELVLAIGITFPILKSEIPFSLQKNNYIYFQNEDLKTNSACHDAIFCMPQLNNYREVIRECIATYYKKRGVKRVHILYSGPTSLAFSLGTMITPTHDPEIISYQYYGSLENNYPWGISLANTSDANCIVNT